MQKPNNYDETLAPGEFTPITPGGHLLVIMDYKETDEKGQPLVTPWGARKVTVFFDTAPADKQPGYFAQQFRSDIRPNKAWPYNGKTDITIEDEEGKCTRQFKGFATSLEKSNPGFTFPWSDNENVTAAGVKKKLVGGVFGIEKDWSADNKEIKRHKLRWFCGSDKIESAEIPEWESKNYKEHFKEGQQTLAGMVSNLSSSDGFMNIPDGITDEELPFN